MKCKNCGIHELTTGDTDGMCAACRGDQQKGIFGNYGWICPVCGAGNSPYSTICPCRTYPNMEITCKTE